MKKKSHLTKKTGFLFIVCFMSISAFAGQMTSIEKGTVLVTNSDLYCSFFLHETPFPDLVISGAEREGEKALFTDGDIVYLNKGENGGLKVGDNFIIVEKGPELKKHGYLAFKKGRVRVISVKKKKATAILENTCWEVRIGSVCFPLAERDSLLGEDLGFDVVFENVEGPTGHFLYLQTDYNQIGPGHWALISLGEKDGLEVGQQLLVCRKSDQDSLPLAIGNAVVLDTRTSSSTIKILSSKEAIHLDDLILLRPAEDVILY
jgi:hypothetical protein